MTSTAQAHSLSAPTRHFLDRAGKLLIGGQWIAAQSGKTFAVVDPATGDPIGPLRGGREGRRRRGGTVAPGRLWKRGPGRG